jgi:hypothetical protein
MAVKRPVNTVLPYVVNGTGAKTSSAIIKASPGILAHIVVTTDGANDATAQINDSPDSTLTSDAIVGYITVNAADRIGGIVGLLVECTKGMYLTLTGTGATAYIYYI